MAKKELTPEELELLREKRRLSKKRREQQIKQMMDENKRAIGEKKFEKTKNEAKNMVRSLKKEAVLKMSDEEILAKMEHTENAKKRHGRNYLLREKEKKEQILNDKNASPEFIKKFLLAKKTTKSTTVAKRLAETCTEEELTIRYDAYRKKVKKEVSKRVEKKKLAAEKGK